MEEGIDVEDLSFATRAPIHLCGGEVRFSLSLSASGLPRNRFRIGYVYTPRGFLLRPNDLKGSGRGKMVRLDNGTVHATDDRYSKRRLFRLIVEFLFERLM